MIVVVNSFLTRFFSLGNADGIMIFPFLFIKEVKFKNQLQFINHEKIHFKQALELGVLLFYVWYLIELLLKSVKYQSFLQGYQNVSFEKEAYKNEGLDDYLSTRRPYAFLKYI